MKQKLRCRVDNIYREFILGDKWDYAELHKRGHEDGEWETQTGRSTGEEETREGEEPKDDGGESSGATGEGLIHRQTVRIWIIPAKTNI